MNSIPVLISEISTFTHILIGISLFIYACFEVLAAFKPKNKIPMLGSFLLFCAGIAGFVFMLDKAGGSPDKLVDLVSKESIFLLFIGLYMLLATTGLIGVMQYISTKLPNFWKLFQIILLGFIAASLYVYPQFLPEETNNVAEQIHKVICYALASGAVISALNVFIKNKVIAFVSVFCFFVTGAILVQYKEEPRYFTKVHKFTTTMSVPIGAMPNMPR